MASPLASVHYALEQEIEDLVINWLFGDPRSVVVCEGFRNDCQEELTFIEKRKEKKG